MSANIKQKLKVATAFSGGLAAIEFALKYQKVNHEIIFACEFDKYARKQYLEFHDEPKTFYSDVRDVDASKYHGKIDLFVWGSPCQDLSLAGKRKGFKGEKSSLFRDGARIQKEMMPKVFIFENVRGLLSSNKGADYEEVLRTFKEQGYFTKTLKLNTKDFGVPHNRPRVFIVGFLDKDEFNRFEEPKPFELELRLKDLLEDEVDEKYYLSQKMIDAMVVAKYESMGISRVNKKDDICNCLTTMGGGNREPKVFIEKIGYINQNTQASQVFGDNGISPSLTAGTHGYAQGYVKIKSATKRGYEIASENDSINLTYPNSKTRRGRVGKGVAQTLDCACNQGVVMGRIVGRNPDNPKSRVSGLPTKQMLEINKNNEITNCLTTVQKDNVVISEFNIRKLTPRECFRLQGVKDEHINLVNSNTQSYKIAGNAISVNVMEELIKSIYKKDLEVKTLIFDFIGA